MKLPLKAPLASVTKRLFVLTEAAGLTPGLAATEVSMA